MVVYEVKDTGTYAQPSRPKPIRREISPTLPVFESKAVGHLLKRNFRDNGQKRRHREAVELNAAGARDVRRLTDQINLRLEKSGAGIHLVLIQEENGFVLDVYDCSNGHVCEVIHDMIVPVDELQGLFAKLQKESGIIFDKSF